MAFCLRKQGTHIQVNRRVANVCILCCPLQAPATQPASQPGLWRGCQIVIALPECATLKIPQCNSTMAWSVPLLCYWRPPSKFTKMPVLLLAGPPWVGLRYCHRDTIHASLQIRTPSVHFWGRSRIQTVPPPIMSKRRTELPHTSMYQL